MTGIRSTRWKSRKKKGYIEIYDARSGKGKKNKSRGIPGEHHLTGWWVSLFVGSFLIVLATVRPHGYIAFAGVLLVLFSIVMLLMLHYHHGHITFSFRYGEKRRDKEQEIVRSINALLRKQRSHKRDEKQLRKEIEILYKKASTLQMGEAKRIVPEPATQDVSTLLKVVDKLLADLPEDKLNAFIHSKDYTLYKSVMSHYKIK